MSSVLIDRLNHVRLDGFCRRHGIRRLSVFGSVLGPDFSPDSDIDMLVEYCAGRVPGLLEVAAMELELGDLIGREVELRTYNDLSRRFRDDVVSRALPLYAPE